MVHHCRRPLAPKAPLYPSSSSLLNLLIMPVDVDCSIAFYRVCPEKRADAPDASLCPFDRVFRLFVSKKPRPHASTVSFIAGTKLKMFRIFRGILAGKVRAGMFGRTFPINSKRSFN